MENQCVEKERLYATIEFKRESSSQVLLIKYN